MNKTMPWVSVHGKADHVRPDRPSASQPAIEKRDDLFLTFYPKLLVKRGPVFGVLGSSSFPPPPLSCQAALKLRTETWRRKQDQTGKGRAGLT